MVIYDTLIKKPVQKVLTDTGAALPNKHNPNVLTQMQLGSGLFENASGLDTSP